MTSLGQALYTASASKRYLSGGAAQSPKEFTLAAAQNRHYCVHDGLRLPSVHLSTKAAWGLTGSDVPKSSRGETSVLPCRGDSA